VNRLYSYKPAFLLVHAVAGKNKAMKQQTLKQGFTLVEIMIVVAIIGLLASLAIPNFVQSRKKAQQTACINNLRLIDSAKQQWALENKKVDTDTPVGADLQPYIGRGATGQLPTCSIDPAQTFDTSYTPGNLAVNPACKILPATHLLP